MKSLAVIPARGGSKRIPRKNVKEFLGKPIIAYSIEVALNSGLFDEVMVSTDDEEIAEVAKKYGAKVPFMRSSENADDHSSTADVIVEVITSYESQNRSFDFICCIYPTAPLIKENNLHEAKSLLVDNYFTTVLPVTPFSYPIWRSLKLEGNKVKMNWPEHLNSRSQDLPLAYHDAGQFYWLDCKKFLADPRLFSEMSGAIILAETEVQDIDNESDWKIAEAKYQLSDS